MNNYTEFKKTAAIRQNAIGIMLAGLSTMHKTASYAQFKEAAAGYSMPKGLGDALAPAPAPMKLENPQQAAGNKMMNEAAVAEGVPTNAAQPVSEQEIVAKAIDTVDKGNQGLLKYLTQINKQNQPVQQAAEQPVNPVV